MGGDQGQDPDCPSHDCDQLVHLSCGLPFPHARHQRSQCRGFHSDWLLRVRHHFQVRRWPCDLSDHLCQVQQGGPLELKCKAFLLKTCPGSHIRSSENFDSYRTWAAWLQLETILKQFYLCRGAPLHVRRFVLGRGTCRHFCPLGPTKISASW